MKYLISILIILIAASCVSAKKAATLGDFELCYIATVTGDIDYFPSDRKNAKEEVRKRGLDCRVHYAAINREVARKQKLWKDFQEGIAKQAEIYGELAESRRKSFESLESLSSPFSTLRLTKSERSGTGMKCTYGIGIAQQILFIQSPKLCPREIPDSTR